MDLVQKGSEANVGSFKQLIVEMNWSTAADFDLAAAYVKKDETPGLVYFGNMGDLNAFPFIELSGDEGVGDKGGDNKETLRIMNLDDMKYVYLLCWDYGKIKTGEPARFAGSDVKLNLMDDKGVSHNVNLDTGDMGNVALIATIDCSSPIGSKLVNTSKAGTLKGLEKLEDLMAIINK